MRLDIARATAAAAALTAVALAARADFQAALGEYNAGHYDAAHAQFLQLAELGDCSSQFNLGAMALKGQGGPRDTGSGVGWLEAASGNGCEHLVGNKLPGLTAKLNADEARSAAAIVARYGHAALQAQGVVNPELSCSGMIPAQVLQSPAPDDPRPPGARSQSAIVITALTVGTDGRARDPEILLAVPEGAFAPAAVEAWLNSRFAPAQRDGHVVESRLLAKLLFAAADGSALGGTESLRRAGPAADGGDPAAGYLVGLTATLDTSLGISATRGGQLLLASARDGYAQSQYWVGSQLHYATACEGRPDGAVWLRHAAEGGNASAQVLRAAELLGGGAAQAAEARALLLKASGSDSYYVRKHVVALLAASPLEAVRDPDTALKVAQRLALGPIQSDPQMFEALAAAYAANGDFDDARSRQRQAIGKAQALAWNTERMAERLAAYKRGKPWHGDLFVP